MRIKSFLIALLCLPFMASAQEKISSPKLYLNIVVDQLRTDFLYEFSQLYGEGGIRFDIHLFFTVGGFGIRL